MGAYHTDYKMLSPKHGAKMLGIDFHTAQTMVCKLFAASVLFFACLCFSPFVYAQSAAISGPISSQDIYENPDDHQLNLNYAKQEIKRGEMLNAASALERMLYANPNWHSARLLYAAVLYRLDDPKAAMRELSLLENRNLNEQQIKTYERYLVDFEKPLPPRSTAGSGNVYAPHDGIKASLNIGFRADNNAGNALTDEGFGFSNQGDVSLHAQGRVAVSTAITETHKAAAYASLSGQIRRHETFFQADYDVIDLQGGVRVKPGETGLMSLGLDARQININGEKYLRQIGPRLSVNQKISETLKASVNLSVYHQDYDVLPNAALEDERDGYRTRFQLALQKQLKPSEKLTVAVGYDTKTAEIGAFAYEGPQALLGFEKTLDKGPYLKTNLQLRVLDYRDSLDPNIDERKDTRFSARQALGIPLNASSWSSSSVKTAAVELGFNYNNRASNVDSNDYKNFGVDVKLKLNF